MRRLILLVLAACIVAPALPARVQAQGQQIPKLVGTWEAAGYAMHDTKHGFTTGDKQSATLVIKEQQGRVFTGEVTWGGKTAGKDTVSGVIDKNGEEFYFIGHADGLRLGKLEGPDAMVFYFLSSGGNNPRAGYVEYRRK
jgi:hypothetical protein